MAESGSGEFDGKTPPTEQELKNWRRMYAEYSHASWMFRKALPFFVAATTMLSLFVAWIYSHWKT